MPTQQPYLHLKITWEPETSAENLGTAANLLARLAAELRLPPMMILEHALMDFQLRLKTMRPLAPN